MNSDPDSPPETQQSRTRALRVALFSESFAPVRNGVTTALNTLISGMREAGHRVWVCAPAHDDQESSETNVLRFPSFETAYNRGYPLAYPFYPRLALSTHFNRLRLDIVHTHTPFVLGLTGAKLAINRGKPLISTFHTLYSQYTHYVPMLPDMMSQSLLDVYLPWYYNRCSHVLCPSALAKEALLRVGVETPIAIVPTGIPLPAPSEVSANMRLKTRNSFGWHNRAHVLLYAGRIVPEKNIAWLFEVLARVKLTYPDTLLVLAGDGYDSDRLMTLSVTMGLQDSVQFLGAIERSDMNRLYAAADVFCFPSESETQGLVIGEARAAGLPVVVVDAGGAPETVTDGEDGFRVPPGDVELFTQRVSELIGNRALHQRIRRAAKLRAADFTPERMIARIVEVYKIVESQAPRARSIVPPFEGKVPYWNIFLAR